MITLVYDRIDKKNNHILYNIKYKDKCIGIVKIMLNKEFFLGVKMNEINIYIKPQYRNKGYGFEALKKIINNHKYMEICSVVKADNLASLALHDKLKADNIKIYEKDNDLYKCYIFNRKL